MNVEEQLRQTIDQQRDNLRLTVPADRHEAVAALLRALDRYTRGCGTQPFPDLVTGLRIHAPGGNKALELCVDGLDDRAADATSFRGREQDAWAERFLFDCGQLAQAELVRSHYESGFMRIEATGDAIHAWITTKLIPANWRERADITWWARWLAGQHERQLHAMRVGHVTWDGRSPDQDAQYFRLADLHLEMMAYELGYPPDTEIGGCSVRVYCDVLRQLIVAALRSLSSGKATMALSESELIADIAANLGIDATLAAHAVSVFTLDRINAAYHAAVPGVAAAPLVRVGSSRLALSLYGLTSEPLFFLTRELRRRDAEGYHNSAVHREAIFRQDLYSLFDSKRYVTSVDRVTIRGNNRDVRTDIDAVIFDRKTGTLGLFELKSHDPFAKSPAALVRQRDSVLYANRQISGMLDWLKRNGADEILSRVDRRVAKTFRVHNVYPFVLGRYLVRFSDGPLPDRRAAWGTWPQLLRLLDQQPLPSTGGNPLATLFSRISNDVTDVQLPADMPPQEIRVGRGRIIVHRSYAAYQSTVSGKALDND